MKLRKISLDRPTRRLLFETMDVNKCSSVLPLASISLLKMTTSVESYPRGRYRPSDFDYKYRIDEEGNLL